MLSCGAGLAQVHGWLLAPLMGPALGPIAAGAGIPTGLSLLHKKCHRSSNRLTAFAYHLLLAAGYWVPAVHSIGHVCAAMLRCPGLAQLPAALVSPAVLPHLALMLLACERWLARGHKEQAALAGLAPSSDSIAQIVAACKGRFGCWALDGCRSALYLLSPLVR